MRILHADTGTGWRGGQQQILWLMEGLRALGAEQMLLAPPGAPLWERARREGFAVAELMSPVVSRQNLRMLRRKAEGCDLLHAHDARAHTLAWVAGFAGSKQSWRKLVVSRRVAFPIGFFSRLKYSPDRFFPPFSRASRERLSEAAPFYIAVSEHVRQQLLRAGVPASRVRVIYDGVKPPPCPTSPEVREEFRKGHGVGEQIFLLGTLSSPAPEKLLQQQIELLAELPPHVHFWLGCPAAETSRAGDETALAESARRLGLEQRVRFLSLTEDVGAFLASLDAFLYLSRSEGLGSAILLAMAHNLPVVASKVGGIPEIVRHQKTGLLVSSDHPQEIVPTIRQLLESPDLRQRLASAGREFVLTHATDAIMVAQTAALYRELISESGPGSR